MAQVGRAGLLQLPRGTGEHGQFKSISSAGDPSLATDTALPQPNAPSSCGPNVCTRETLASRCAYRKHHRGRLTTESTISRSIFCVVVCEEKACNIVTFSRRRPLRNQTEFLVATGALRSRRPDTERDYRVRLRGARRAVANQVSVDVCREQA